jgi:hypothetical protein
MVKADKNKSQLFYLLPKLHACAEDNNEFGMLLAYTILASLFELQSKTGSSDELRIEEIKTVYAGIEKAIEMSLREGGYAVLCDLKTKLDPQLKNTDHMNAIEAGSSPMLKKLIWVVLTRRGAHEDVLRKIGLRLAAEVSARGPLYSRIDFFTHDHKLIEFCFRNK